MSDPQVSFQYEPTKQDRIMGCPNANGFVRSEPVPGCDASLQLPGARDSEILILDQNRKNVASHYDTLRYMRTWTLACGPGYTPIGPIYNWNLDTQGNGPSWLDIPGEPSSAVPRNGRKSVKCSNFL
jgi:hypothetical protein